MSFRLLAAAVLGLSLSVVHGARAHHAFAANYDIDNIGTVEGKIAEVAWSNPHVHYYIQVANEDGSTDLWDVESSNLSGMTARNWDRNTLRVGDEIRVTGALGRNGIHRIQMRDVVRLDSEPLPSR